MFNEKKIVYKIVYNVWSQLYLSMFINVHVFRKYTLEC